MHFKWISDAATDQPSGAATAGPVVNMEAVVSAAGGDCNNGMEINKTDSTSHNDTREYLASSLMSLINCLRPSPVAAAAAAVVTALVSGSTAASETGSQVIPVESWISLYWSSVERPHNLNNSLSASSQHRLSCSMSPSGSSHVTTMPNPRLRPWMRGGQVAATDIQKTVQHQKATSDVTADFSSRHCWTVNNAVGSRWT